MAAVQHRHVVFFRHGVDGIEEGEEVALGVDVLLPVGREQDVPALLQAEPLMDIRGLYLRQVLPQHLGHRGAGDIGALPRQPALREVSPRVLAVGQVHVRDDVHYPAVGLLGKALVLAPVAGLHVEDGDVQPLRADDAQAGVGVPEDQHGVGPGGRHELVAGVDDVAACGPQVVPDGVHIDVGVLQLQVAEEDAVEVVVVVLPRVGQQRVEVPAGFVDDDRQADDLRPGAHDDQQPDPAVVLEVYVGIICLEFHVLLLFLYWVKICVGTSRVEDLVAVHHCDQVLRLREVYDVVGVARKHNDALYPVAADLVTEYLVRALFAHLYEAVAGDDDELLPLGVVPVLPLGDARPGDVDGHLTAAGGLHKFCEAAAPVGVHFKVEDRLLLGQIAQVGAQKPLREAVGGHLRNHEGPGHVGESAEHVHDLAQFHMVGERGGAVAAVTTQDCIDSVEPAAVLPALKGQKHLVHQVVDVQQLQLHIRIVDMYRQAVGDVVAEGGHRAVVVRAAPLAVEVGEAVHQNPRAGLLRIFEEQLLAGPLAPAVPAVAEAAGEGGLDTGGEHDGAGVAVSFKGIKKGGGESEVAAHELLRVLRAVDTGQVEYEVGLGAPCVQIPGRGVDVVLVDLIHGYVIVAGPAVADVAQLGAQVPAYEPTGPGNKYSHCDIV